MKRVKYKEIKDNIFVSTSEIISALGGKYKVTINLNDMTYKISNLNTKRIVKSTKKDGVKIPINKQTVYRQVNRALKQLKVMYEKEIRIQRKTSV